MSFANQTSQEIFGMITSLAKHVPSKRIAIFAITMGFLLAGCNSPVERIGGGSQTKTASSYYPEQCVIDSMKVNGITWNEARTYCNCMYDQISSGNQKPTFAAEYCEKQSLGTVR